ncbi:MAG TPA: PAS domain-containing protein, partial [Thermodesulfobacteriota bacterium]|nr:PAS domain-containing protein [Thermodesulfobacteriota bacterium]
NIEREIQTKDGHWYIMRIIPYRTLLNYIDGIILTFVDIHEQRKTRTLRDALAYAEAIVDTVREPLIVLDKGLNVISANDSFYKTFRVAKENTENKPIYELGNRQWDIPKLREFLEEIVSHNTQFNDYLVEHNFPQIGQKSMLLNARRIDLGIEKENLLLLAIEDVTDRKKS